MARYRKKPVVIEAEQWFPGKDVPGVEMYRPQDVVLHSRVIGQEPQVFPQDPYPAVKTLEGWLRVSPGDYIITGVKGEKYPCKPEIFLATYELAE